MSDIFLSYASEDRERLYALVEALKRQGWSVFWDRTIAIGQSWDRVLGHELETCTCVVVVWTNTSVKSRWVYEEASEGNKKNALFPVALDPVSPPLGFRMFQIADLTSWDGSSGTPAFSRLVKDIAAHPEMKQKYAAQMARKVEQERQAVEAARKAEQERQAVEAARKAEQERQAVEAAHKAEQERQAVEAAHKAKQVQNVTTHIRGDEQVQTPKLHEVDEETLHAARYQLAGYLGPIANLLVRKAAQQAKTTEHFIETLAHELDNEQQRMSFLRRMRK